jgi:hypothetical protein
MENHMHVDWTALGLVLLISLAATGVLVTLVALGIAALGRRADHGAGTTVHTTAAALCFLGAATLVGFGLYLVIVG